MKGIHLKYVFCALIACSFAAPEIKADITCRYWFDSETDLSRALTEKFDGNSIKLNLDASQLPYGLHKVSVMVGSSDQWSPVLCKLFYKPEPQIENVSRILQINVDGKKLYDKDLAAESDVISLDVAELPVGLHRLDCMLLSSTGEAITTGQQLFYKPERKDENVSHILQVNVDGKKLYDTDLATGSDIITLDAAKLPTGLHRLDCMLLSSTGEAITTGQKLFYKPEPEMSLSDWKMTFLADDQQLWNGSISEKEEVILLDASAIKAGISRLVCLFTSSKTGESFIAEKKDFYKPSDAPNSIRGYLSAAGSEYVGEKVKELGYSIEFENSGETDAEPINQVEVKCALDPDIFELSSFRMREIKIGGKTLSLDGRKSFHERLDMRPERDVIADVVCEFDEKNGNIVWRISSLDPETLNPTEEKSVSILPANTDGWGAGEIVYEVELRENLADGTIIDNTALIGFDGKEIANPSWRNILDLTLPKSHIESIEEVAGGYEFEISGSDTGSGIWKYELYRKNQIEGTWEVVMTDIYDTHFVYEDNSPSETPRFATIAIDRAGNVEISSDMTDGINTVLDETEDAHYYMLNGVKATDDYKGVLVGKGRKIIKANH